MPNHKSCLKRIRQTKKRNTYNRAKKKDLKLAVRAVYDAGNYNDAMEALNKAQSVLDRVTYKGVIHKNTASRKKARLSAFVKKMKEATA